ATAASDRARSVAVAHAVRMRQAMSTQTTHRPPAEPGRTRRDPRLLVTVVLAAVAVVAASVITALVVRSDNRNAGTTTPSASPPASAPQAPSPSALTPSTPSPSAGASTSPGSSTPEPTVPVFGFQPLWPFTGVPDAMAWQEAYRSGGHQPWHLDAGLTALSFASGYLGYTEVNKVTGISVVGRHAWVKVGYNDPNGRPATVANLHLAKIGTGRYAPWEVVGSRDTLLTLTIPAYGATVLSPLTVGGRITGVDESLVVQIHTLSREQAVGRTGGIPAGGVNMPWRATVR